MNREKGGDSEGMRRAEKSKVWEVGRDRKDKTDAYRTGKCRRRC